jgi:hypothetical protein
MSLSRMLTGLGTPNLVLEKYPSLQNHPKAHYLSFRSCEILQDLFPEDNFLKQQMTRVGEWNAFNYCRSVASQPFARVEHLPKS